MKTFLPIFQILSPEYENQEVSLHGWAYRERGSGNDKFVVVRDSTEIIQCVIDKEVVGEENFKTADKLHLEASLELTGIVKKEPRAPTGYELHVKNFQVIGPCDNFPIAKNFSPEFLLDNRHLWLRSRKMTAVLKIRHTVFGAIHDYFREQGFYEYQSPIFQPAAAEGGSTLFEVNYFGKPLYLAQTWQLYAEPAIFSLEKIYTLAPSFRAEKSKTSRHLTEYWHAEMEMAWSKFEDIQDHAEGVIKACVKAVLENNQEELKVLERDPKKLEPTVKKTFPRTTYTDVLKDLEKKAKIKVEWGKDLRTVEEDVLSTWYDTPVIITRYPKVVKAFYMKEDPENSKVVLGFDIIAPEGYGEVVGASQREEDIQKIENI